MFLIVGRVLVFDVDFVRAAVGDHALFHRIFHALHNRGHGDEAHDSQHDADDRPQRPEPMRGDFPQADGDCVDEDHGGSVVAQRLDGIQLGRLDGGEQPGKAADKRAETKRD